MPTAGQQMHLFVFFEGARCVCMHMETVTPPTQNKYLVDKLRKLEKYAKNTSSDVCFGSLGCTVSVEFHSFSHHALAVSSPNPHSLLS